MGLADKIIKLFAAGDGMDLNRVLRNSIIAVSIFGVILLVLLLIIHQNESLIPTLTYLSIAGAFSLGGAAIGFLFGIPRTEKFRFQPTNDRSGNTARGTYYYGDNTNLEEISDWLTKIIVGLTLVKFATIQNWMHQAAVVMSRTLHHDHCKDDCGEYYVFSYSVMLMFLLAGAAMGYLWTRINFSRILTHNRKYLEHLETLKYNQQVAGLKLVNPELSRSDEEVMKTMSLAPTDRDEMLRFKALVEKENQSRPVIDKTDLQKGRWGRNPEKNEYRLYAEVNDSSTSGLYEVSLSVMYMGSNLPPLNVVAFLLHDTFPKQIVYATFNAERIASLKVIAFEAFTAGAFLPGGTDLELDLNTIKGLPNGFYWT